MVKKPPFLMRLDPLKLPFLMGLLLGVSLVGCAGFSYRYYGLKGADYTHGTMVGPSQNDDISFTNCAPSQAHKYPCIIIPVSDFYKLKQDYESIKSDLIACQRGRG